MNALIIANTIIKLLPHIAATCRAVEELDETPGKGGAKLQVVLAIVKGVYEAANPAVAFDDLRATVEKVIAAVVDFYNSIGVFRKALAGSN